VWNYVNDLFYKMARREGRIASAFDIAQYTCGATKEGLSLHTQTVQAITEEYVTRRKQFKKSKLNWRVSNPKSSRYSLGWIPLKSSAIAYRNGQAWFGGKAIALWDSFVLKNYATGDSGEALALANSAKTHAHAGISTLRLRLRPGPKKIDPSGWIKSLAMPLALTLDSKTSLLRALAAKWRPSASTAIWSRSWLSRNDRIRNNA
jgi:hypothetical protein